MGVENVLLISSKEQAATPFRVVCIDHRPYADETGAGRTRNPGNLVHGSCSWRHRSGVAAESRKSRRALQSRLKNTSIVSPPGPQN